MASIRFMLEKLFGREKKHPGWMAMSFIPEGLCLAHVQRVTDAKPVVTVCGVAADEGMNPKMLEKTAREMRLSHYHCSTLLVPHEYQMLVVEAPNVPPLELKTAMRWRIKDLLDFHIDDATIDVMDIPPDKNGGARAHSMYAVAARNSAIERRVKLFDAAKVPLEVIDIPELAQRNIAARLEEAGRGLALISFNDDGGLLTVTYGGELYLARHLDIGWQQLLRGEAESRETHFERITLELQRSLDNIERQFPFISISRLWIAFMPAAEALRAYLVNNLSVSVSVLDLNDVFDFSQVPAVGALNNQTRFFLTLGASLRHEERAL